MAFAGNARKQHRVPLLHGWGKQGNDRELKDSICCAVSGGGRQMVCFTTVKYHLHTMGDYSICGDDLFCIYQYFCFCLSVTVALCVTVSLL